MTRSTPHGSPAGPRSAFTLIELLVVISIVALLISLLLPALSGARATAKMLICATNLRSVSVAQAMYHADSGGWTPDTRTHWDGSRWVEAVDSWASNRNTASYAAKLMHGGYFGTIHKPDVRVRSEQREFSVFACPDDAGRLIGGYTGLTPLSYFPNALGYFGAQWTSSPRAWMVNVDNVPSASNMFLLIELNFSDANPFFNMPLPTASGQSPFSVTGEGIAYDDPRVGTPIFVWNHAQRKNVSFADGHVQTLSQPDFGYVARTGTATEANWYGKQTSVGRKLRWEWSGGPWQITN